MTGAGGPGSCGDFDYGLSSPHVTHTVGNGDNLTVRWRGHADFRHRSIPDEQLIHIVRKGDL